MKVAAEKRPLDKSLRTAGLVGTSRRTILMVLRSAAASSVITAVVGFVILPRVVHGLTLRRYGEWATLAAILAIGQLVQAGAGVEISRRVAGCVGADDAEGLRRATMEGVTVLSLLGLAVEGVTVIVAHPVVSLVFGPVSSSERNQLAHILVAIIGIFALSLWASGYLSALTGMQRQDYVTWSTAAALIMSALVTVVGIDAGLGLWALVLGSAVQLVVSLIGPLVGIRRLLSGMSIRLVRPTPRLFLAFLGMPAMVVMASASDLFDSQIDKLVLSHGAGPSASAMFQIGVGLVQSMRGVILLPLGFLLAGTAELHQRDPERLRWLEGMADSAVQGLAAVAAGGFLIFGTPFMAAWLGPGYGQAALALRVLGLAALVNAWSAPWAYYALGRGRYYYVLVSAGVTLAVNLVATVFLTTRFGLDGALIGSLAGSVAGMLSGRIMLQRWERRRWMRPGLRASACVAVIVVPVLAGGVEIARSWPLLVGEGVMYVVGAGVILLFTRSLPVKLVFDSPLPRIVVRR